MDKISSIRKQLIAVFLLTFFFTVEIWAQMPSVHVPKREEETASAVAAPQMEDDTWWYVTIFLLLLGLVGALFWWYSTKKAAESESASGGKQSAKPTNKKRDADAVDAGKEMEWYRKNQKTMGKKEVHKSQKNFSRVNNPLSSSTTVGNSENETGASAGEIRVWTFDELPISSFSDLKTAAEYDLLPLSNDPALMSAIEQTQEEFEEDEEVRSLSLRILTAFKTRNAADALAQVAHYDLSSNLRSKAVTTLAEFDHESVFENVLLACADPTREVRAAAARGLFRLSFDRADAWTRIAETHDEFRMRQAARAAAEADLVERSFDRLIHPDRKVAYEAFALTALLIKAGESERIFATIEKHRDKKVKLALLHVVNIVKDEETLPNLYALLEQNSIAPEIKEKADQIIHSFELVPA